MRKTRLKKSAIFTIYGVSLAILFATIFLVENLFFKSGFKEKDDFIYVSKTIFDNEVPVVSMEQTIIKPYVDESVKVLKKFYDYRADENTQENALIYYEGTYIPNSGIAYGGTDSFDVISILDGTVVAIKKDNLLGNVVQIRHEEGIISVYQSLGEVNVKENDVIKQGHVIGKSGTSNLNKNLNNHLLFELIIEGQTVNPESYYDKKVDDL